MTQLAGATETVNRRPLEMVRAEEAFNFGESTVSAEAFAVDGLVVFRGFIRPVALNRLLTQIKALMPKAMRKDFLMPQTGHSPRNMTVLGGKTMNAQLEIMCLYSSGWVLRQLSKVTGLKVAVCDDPVENVIATNLNALGDTHGWHTDDYPLAFILVLEMPSPGRGGHVELRQESGFIQQVHLEAGDAYLLRSDKIVHRVAPLTETGSRTILNFTYSQDGLCVSKNGTAPLLCDE